MISSLMVTRSMTHHHHLPTFVLSIAICAMVMPSKHDVLQLKPLSDLLWIIAPVHFLLTLLSGCRPLMSRSFVIELHCMLKTRRSSSPISSAKSAAPPVRQVASHTTTIAISWQRHPDAIHSLISFCNLVAGDHLTDGPERMALVTGKGTVLLKANSDVRPIVTEKPLWH